MGCELIGVMWFRIMIFSTMTWSFGFVVCFRWGFLVHLRGIAPVVSGTLRGLSLTMEEVVAALNQLHELQMAREGVPSPGSGVFLSWFTNGYWNDVLWWFLISL